MKLQRRKQRNEKLKKALDLLNKIAVNLQVHHPRLVHLFPETARVVWRKIYQQGREQTSNFTCDEEFQSFNIVWNNTTEQFFFLIQLTRRQSLASLKDSN